MRTTIAFAQDTIIGFAQNTIIGFAQDCINWFCTTIGFAQDTIIGFAEDCINCKSPPFISPLCRVTHPPPPLLGTDGAGARPLIVARQLLMFTFIVGILDQDV